MTFEEFYSVVKKIGIDTTTENMKSVYNAAISPEGSASREKEVREGVRSLPLLGAGLMNYAEQGMWPKAVTAIITKSLPPGALRDHAVRRLPLTMKKYDKAGSGVVPLSQMPYVLRDIMTPGVDMKTLAWLLRDQIGIPVPFGLMEKHFNIADRDKDCFLDALDFITAIRGIFGEYIPHVVMELMGLANRRIVGAVLYAL